MKPLAFILFLGEICIGQPLPNLGFGSANAGYSWSGPKTVYPGFSHYFGFPTTRWRVPVTCSATGNTCNTAGSGYTPTGNEINVYVTAATPPTGLDTMATGSFANYKICNVSGTQFQLGRSNACTTIETFSSTGTAVSILFVPASGLTDGYIVSNTGWPSGTVLTWGYTNSGLGWLANASVSANGNPINNFNNQNQMVLRADIPTGATLGDDTITITTCTTDTAGGMCSGRSDTLTFTVTVTAATRLSDANEPTSFPAIPGISAWSSYMTDATSGGAHWCTKSTGATNPTNLLSVIGNDNSISYYDGGLTYWRIARWTGDPQWLNCAQNILQQIGWGNVNSGGIGYLLPINGSAPGYRIFPKGYQAAALQDARYVGPVQYQAGLMDSPYGGSGGASFLLGGCNPSDAFLRENSYALDIMLAIDEMGLTPAHDQPGTPSFNTWTARRQRCADEIVQILDAYVNGTKRFTENQYFITGIGLDALIHWWQQAKDPRVPLIVKSTLDQYYSNYNIAGHKAMWDPEPIGPRCLNVLNWFVSGVDDHCQDNTSVVLPQLHNLFGHAFAWYWRVSGDVTYRTEGDEVFSHALDQPADLGKTFNQMYRYSFNYVGWRQGWLSPEKSIE